MTRVFISSIIFLFTLTSFSSSAVMINFKALAESNSIGESAWSPLYFDINGDLTTNADAFLTITTQPDGSYAYLDANNAGLGVCKELKTIDGDLAPANVATESGNNICKDGGDDNTTFSESLLFTFSEAVYMDELWINNNHDGGLQDGETVLLNGDAWEMDGITSVWDTEFNLFDNTGNHTNLDYAIYDFSGDVTTSFTLAYGGTNAEQFYVEQIKFDTIVEDEGDDEPDDIPEPGTLSLFGLALLGISMKKLKVKL